MPCVVGCYFPMYLIGNINFMAFCFCFYGIFDNFTVSTSPISRNHNAVAFGAFFFLIHELEKFHGL